MLATTLAELLRHDVAQFGGRTAITIDDRGLTYAELSAYVAAAKARLAPLVAPGDRVAIWLPNGFAWIASFLALAELGAVSVPANTRLTIPELEVILEDASVRAVLATEYRGRDYVAEAHEAAKFLTPFVIAAPDSHPDDWKITQTGHHATASAPIEGRDVFCIQYTSGTTSTPKGVMLTQKAYIQTAEWCARCQLLTPETHFMSAAPFFHCSGSLHAITVALLAGCTLHSVSIWNPAYFVTLIARHQGTVSHGIFFRDIVSLGPDIAGPGLATLRIGHDIGGVTFVTRLHDEFGITGISNIYGMTETCGNFTMWFPDDPLDKRIALNGRPQPGNQIRIADPATGAVLPRNHPGEIQMRGPTITQGYYRRPEANRLAFSEDGWFRSGDLGTLNEQNELHFMARLRDIIRVGGENVSPVEIEMVVQQITGLKLFSVIGVPDPRLGEVAALVLPHDADLDWPNLQAQLTRRLAGFKLPRHVYRAATLPLTATDKVQRATLQQWIRDGKLDRIA